MITSVRFNTAPFIASMQSLQEVMQHKIVKDAAEAGGNVIVQAYRAALPRYNPPGSFKNAAGVIEHFQQAFMSVGQRTLLFKDGNGAYSVVGIVAAKGSWKPVAPQALFIEGGTVERHHKSGHPTGKTPAQHLLERVAESNVDAAQSAFAMTLSSGIAAHVAAH